jgi:MoaA/NifB/PqqE/SkfB family radical SAM enzyme
MNEFRPYTIQFEGLSVCNATCIFCPVTTDMTRGRGEMSDELFHKIIKEGKELRIKRFVPFLNGEPFLHSKIFEWLDYMEKEGVNFLIYTNAALLNTEKIDKLVTYKHLEFINISLSAATADTHKRVMRLNNFDEIVENIKYLSSKAKFKVYVSFNVLESNKHEIPLFKSMWKGIVKARLNDFMNWGGYKHDPIEKSSKKGMFCQHLKNIYVLWDGRVCLCCFDFDGNVILGDLNKESIKEVWDRTKPIRDKQTLLNFDLPLCRDCNVNRLKEEYVFKDKVIQ